MNKINRRLVMAGGALTLAGCGSSKFQDYDGPQVTSLLAYKGTRSLYLLHNESVLESYNFELGGNPIGPKQFEGDGKTPEGTYRIFFRNPNSAYHLSIGISYPNLIDVARARSAGQEPGGDIFIHGTPPAVRGDADWTAGCFAVTNKEIEEIYAMVQVGTPIFIYP